MSEQHPSTDTTIPRFQADPDKLSLIVRREDLSEVVGTIGLILSMQLSAIVDLTNGQPELAREQTAEALTSLRQLTEQYRALLGMEQAGAHDRR